MPALQSLSQWASSPATYELLATEDGEAGPMSATPSTPTNSSHASADAFLEKPHLHAGLGRRGPVWRAALLLPTLAVRCVHLGWLLATQPLRRWRHRLAMFRVLVPSFLQTTTTTTTTATKPLHPTAWLDGLRGVAAVCVVWHHASLLWFGWHIHDGYGSTPQATWLVQLPVVRLAVSGPPAVAVFFVVSGYALSCKPLRLARQRRFDAAGAAIGSATFRRPLRLFLLPLLVSFCAALLIHWDLYGTAGWAASVAIPSRRPPRAATLAGQLHNWWLSVLSLTNPVSKDLQRGSRFGYDPNLWTLPVELDCSLALFLCQAALVRVRSRVRLVLVLAVAAYCMKYMYWQHFLFFAGMLLCDLRFELDGLGLVQGQAAAAADTPLPSATTPENTAPPRPYRRLAGLATFVASLYLLSMPESGRGGPRSPGYVTLFAWVPALHKEHKNTDFFWVPLAAALLVLAVDHTPALQRRLFAGPFPQYLGRISYSLYLVHGPLLFTAGHWLVRHTTALTGGLAGEGRQNDPDPDPDPNSAAMQLRYGLGIGLSAVVLWMLLLFAADLAARTIDVQAVRLGHVLYARLGYKAEEERG